MTSRSKSRLRTLCAAASDLARPIPIRTIASRGMPRRSIHSSTRIGARNRVRGTSVLRVVDRSSAAFGDREAEAADDGVSRLGANGVHEVGRYVDEVTRADFPCLILDGHHAASGLHEIELVRGMCMGIDGAAGTYLELVHQLEKAT